MLDHLGLVDRDLGSLGVSRGTSLAFESPEVKHYPTLLVNIRTLVRNLFDATRHTDPAQLSVDAIVFALDDELHTLQTRLSSHALIPYYSSYDDVGRVFPGRVTPQRRATKKDIRIQVEAATAAHYAKARANVVDVQNSVNLRFQANGTALLFSHIVSDLFCHYEFRQLDLLSSYSGDIKPRSLWYTKLANCANIPTLPFCRFTLMLYGDHGVLFDPQDILLRRALARLSVDSGWTQRTSMETIRECLTKAIRATRDEHLTTLKRLSGPFS